MTTSAGDQDDDDYRVGYRKPPKHSQFQKGRSGNPQGRPKGSKSLKTELREELREFILVREGEKTKRVTKRCAMAKALVAKALKGDVRAFAHIDAMNNREDPDDAPRTIADLMRRAAEYDDEDEKG